MFQQKQNVRNAPCLAQLDQAPLQTLAGSVVHGSELEDGDQNLVLLRALPLGVNCHSVHAVRSVQHGFRQCWMSMNGPDQIFHGCFEFDSCNRLGD